jgi:hypothetical protein
MLSSWGGIGFLPPPPQPPLRNHAAGTATAHQLTKRPAGAAAKKSTRVDQQHNHHSNTKICVYVCVLLWCVAGLCAAPPCSIGTPQLLDAALCRQHLTKGGHSVASGCLLADSQRRDRCTSINRQKVTCDCVCVRGASTVQGWCAGATHTTHAPAHDNTPATAQTGPCKPLDATPSRTHRSLPQTATTATAPPTALSACVPPLNDRNHQGHLLLLPAAAGPGSSDNATRPKKTVPAPSSATTLSPRKPPLS